MKATTPTASHTYTKWEWGLSTPVGTTRTSSETKGPSRHKPSLFSSFQPMRRVGSTLRTRVTATSERTCDSRQKILGVFCPKSHVKSQNDLNPTNQTRSSWHFSFVPTAILDIEIR